MTGSDIPMEQHPFYHPLYLIRHAKDKLACVEVRKRIFYAALRTEHHKGLLLFGQEQFPIPAGFQCFAVSVSQSGRHP